MSRIGKNPIQIPSGVTVTIEPEQISVTGPKGTLTTPAQDFTSVAQEGEQLIVSRADDSKPARARHGLQRALLQNMVTGVQAGFTKKLEIQGVGFKADMNGKNLKLALGFSHSVLFPVPDGVEVGVDGPIITVTGFDKQQVGQVAADIRALKKPEPYKGKGIRYEDEYVIRKAGKTASSGGS